MEDGRRVQMFPSLVQKGAAEGVIEGETLFKQTAELARVFYEILRGVGIRVI